MSKYRWDTRLEDVQSVIEPVKRRLYMLLKGK